MWRCIDAVVLRFVFWKLYSPFRLDFHSTGAFIQNKKITMTVEGKRRGFTAERERRKGTDCRDFEACKFKPPLVFHPIDTAYTLRCFGVDRWRVDGGVSWDVRSLGTASGFTPPLSLVIYATISPYSLALKKKRRHCLSYDLLKLWSPQQPSLHITRHPQSSESCYIVVGCVEVKYIPLYSETRPFVKSTVERVLKGPFTTIYVAVKWSSLDVLWDM